MRFVISLFSGSLVALFLFWGMHFLILNKTPNISKQGIEKQIDFLRLKHDSEIRKRKRNEAKTLTKKPPPKPAVKAIAAKTRLDSQINIEMPSLTFPPGISGGPALGADVLGLGGISRDLIPLVYIPPQYPFRARQQRKEGFVDLEFTITKEGYVKDISILDAHPKNVFEKAAMRAVSKWKFKPKVLNQKPVTQRAAQLIKFSLTED